MQPVIIDHLSYRMTSYNDEDCLNVSVVSVDVEVQEIDIFLYRFMKMEVTEKISITGISNLTHLSDYPIQGSPKIMLIQPFLIINI